MATITLKNLVVVEEAADQVWNTGLSAVGDPHCDEDFANAGKAIIDDTSEILPVLKHGQTKVAIFGLAPQYIVLEAGETRTITAPDTEAAKVFYEAQASEFLSVEVSGEETGTTADASDVESLNQALDDPSVSQINITGTIQLSEVKSIDRPVTISGGELSFAQTGQNLVLAKGGTLKGVTIRNTSATDTASSRKAKAPEAERTSTYGVQVYKGSATIEDCTFVGGNAGLLVNGSTVTLKGTTTISGMGFGGIEVSKGVRVQTAGILNIEGTIVNADEAYGKPTVWVDGTTEAEGKVNDSQGQLTMAVIKNQNQYYLDPANATNPSN